MKKETITEMKVESSKKTLKSKKSESVMSRITPSNGLFAIVVVLVVMSAIQVYQTQTLLNAVSNGTIKGGAPSQGSSVGLPSQVGGC